PAPATKPPGARRLRRAGSRGVESRSTRPRATAVPAAATSRHRESRSRAPRQCPASAPHRRARWPRWRGTRRPGRAARRSWPRGALAQGDRDEAIPVVLARRRDAELAAGAHAVEDLGGAGALPAQLAPPAADRLRLRPQLADA